MNPLVKFSGPDLNHSLEFTYPNIWQREEYPGWSRLVIGAREREIPLILELCRDMRGSFGVLYALIAPRTGHVPGRYQNPEPISYDTLELFLYNFQEFLEQDGRHHLWVMSMNNDGQFILDNHNVVYGYGDLPRYQSHLSAMGFVPGQVKIPSPHSHHYHQEFDSAEDELMKYWSWIKFPLQPSDDP